MVVARDRGAGRPKGEEGTFHQKLPYWGSVMGRQPGFKKGKTDVETGDHVIFKKESRRKGDENLQRGGGGRTKILKALLGRRIGQSTIENHRKQRGKKIVKR